MKIRVSFKTPDVLHDAINEEVEDYEEQNEWKRFVSLFSSYSGEYITVEFDKDAGTATVIRI